MCGGRSTADGGKHVLLFCFSDRGRSVVHDLKSEVSGDYGQALLVLAEVPELDQQVQ